MPIKRKLKNLAGTAKLVGYDVPKEILKRTFSSSYTHKKVFGDSFGKKK